MKPHQAYLVFSLIYTLSGCTKSPLPDDKTKIQELARSVSVAQVELRNMASRIAASGILVPREIASVSTELSGYIVSELHAEAGDNVSKGDVLASLDSELLLAKISQAEAILEQAESQAELAMLDVQRVNALSGRGVLSDEHIQTKRTQGKVATAYVKKALSELNALLIQKRKLSITAPASGLILERNTQVGDVINGGHTMFTIAENARIEVDAEIPEQTLLDIKLGQSVSVNLASGVRLKGKVRLISPQIDPQTKLARARVSLPSHKGARVGGFAQVFFSPSSNPVTAVPEKAIHFESNGPSLIIIDNNNRAKRQLVKTGTRSDGYVAIESGPPEGAWVALGGGAFLLDGDKVNPIRASDSATKSTAGN